MLRQRLLRAERPAQGPRDERDAEGEPDETEQQAVRHEPPAQTANGQRRQEERPAAADGERDRSREVRWQVAPTTTSGAHRNACSTSRRSAPRSVGPTAVKAMRPPASISTLVSVAMIR